MSKVTIEIKCKRISLEGAERPDCPATAPKPEGSGECVYGGAGNT